MSGMYYYHSDHLGRAIVLTDSDGDVYQRIEYTPFYSRWLSTDPALGDYIPRAGKGTAEEFGKLPGMGGVFNHINGNLYHYAGNNPVKYTDPDGQN